MELSQQQQQQLSQQQQQLDALKKKQPLASGLYTASSLTVGKEKKEESLHANDRNAEKQEQANGAGKGCVELNVRNNKKMFFCCL